MATIKHITVGVTLLIILLTMNTATSSELPEMEDLHELEDKMSMELYGMSFGELKAQHDNTILPAWHSYYEEKIANVERAVQNYILLRSSSINVLV